MAMLVVLNGPPGIGKSTLAARYTDRHPATLNLDVDRLHRLVGGWHHESYDTWPVVWPLARAMAATQLDGGRDVLLPQYLDSAADLDAFARLAREHDATCHELVLLDDRPAALARYEQRARRSDDPWVRHQYRLLRRRDNAFATLYDNLLDLVRQRPGATLIPATGSIDHTYRLLATALRAPA